MECVGHGDTEAIGQPPVNLFGEAVVLEILDPNDHAAPRVVREIFESPTPIKAAHFIVERMRENTEASDLL